jgi:hypothetical protein
MPNAAIPADPIHLFQKRGEKPIGRHRQGQRIPALLPQRFHVPDVSHEDQEKVPLDSGGPNVIFAQVRLPPKLKEQPSIEQTIPKKDFGVTDRVLRLH